MPKRYIDIVWNPDQHRKSVDVSIKHNIDYSVPAPTRGIDMLLTKFRGEPFKTEVEFAAAQTVQVPRLSKPLAESTVAFVTDGGLVPRGNPDGLPPVNADKFCIYPFYGADSLCAADYTVSHQGYDNRYILEDPNRLIPLDAARQAVADGKIAGVFDFFYVTTGVMTSVENSQVYGKRIAASIGANGVDGVILTSTCGTSTRCGAYISCELEKAGIPVVHVTNLAHISEWVGCSRILCGNDISHVFGDPEISPEMERIYRKNMFDKALRLLDSVPADNASLVVRG
ncbi:MAG: glycine/betaine/sarcosine/D-proline family reductase selenoprotein B [Clostridiales bacterium]|nr:glycine/betaine/sarcosine/D-proline family reductase selenoprotein B [Clostridiales bacterium]MDY4180156.1 glycine/betaine/sarcosine/D-proline family reductase selenoprotein B [Pseudoflavonifractor sp.]